jgi:secreted PhoX family phosphatase
MTVYVDDAYIHAAVTNHGYTHYSRWCHLMADTVEELVEFGAAIGLRPEWLQVKRSGVHFDLTDAKRRQAVRAGAVEISVRSEQWVKVAQIARAQAAQAAQSAGVR